MEMATVWFGCGAVGAVLFLTDLYFGKCRPEMGAGRFLATYGALGAVAWLTGPIGMIVALGATRLGLRPLANMTRGQA